MAFPSSAPDHRLPPTRRGATRRAIHRVQFSALALVGVLAGTLLAGTVLAGSAVADEQRPSPQAATKTERILAAQLGEQRVLAASDAELVEAVLDYPFLIDVLAYPDPISGVARLLGEVDALAELRRRDGAEALLGSYVGLPFDLERARAAIVDKSTPEAAHELATLQLQSQLLEALLAHPAFLEPLLERRPEALADAVGERFTLRTALAGYIEPPDPNLTRLLHRALDNPRLDPAVVTRWQVAAQSAEKEKFRMCPSPPAPLPGTATLATTPGCTEYNVCNVSLDWGSEFKAALTSFWTNAYSGLASMIEQPTRRYICHSLAVFETLGQGVGCGVEAIPLPVAKPFVLHSGQWLSNKLITDGSVLEVFDPRDAAMLFYAHTAEADPVLQGLGTIIDHSGKLSTGCFGTVDEFVDPAVAGICVDSKWGWAGPRMRHFVGNDPYSGPYVDAWIDPWAEVILGSFLFPLPPGRQLDVRMFVRSDSVSLEVDPETLDYGPSGGSDTATVTLTPESAGLTWDATVVPSSASSWLHITEQPATGTIDVVVDPYWVTAGTRTATIRVTANAPNDPEDTLVVTQQGPPPPIPDTPDYVGWPSQHCIYSYNNIYTITSELWATSYQWSVTNPAISILPHGNLSRRVYAETAGTSGHLSVRACNISGCSPPATLLLYFNNCGGGGGPL